MPCAPLRWTEARAQTEGSVLLPLAEKNGIRFELDSRVYYDAIFGVTSAELADIAELSPATVLYSTQEAIKGNWEVPSIFTRMEEKVSPISGKIGACHL